jgi:hypothetical protein
MGARHHLASAIFVLACLLVSHSPAFCAEQATPGIAPAPQVTTATPHYEKSTSNSKSPPPKPQIITDEKTNTVRVLIGGKEVLTIDAEGLHVRGNIDYTGIITDK